MSASWRRLPKASPSPIGFWGGHRRRAAACRRPEAPRRTARRGAAWWSEAATACFDACVGAGAHMGDGPVLESLWRCVHAYVRPERTQTGDAERPGCRQGRVHGASRGSAVGGGRLADRSGHGTQLGDRVDGPRAHAPAQAAAAPLPWGADARVRGCDRGCHEALDGGGADRRRDEAEEAYAG